MKKIIISTTSTFLLAFVCYFFVVKKQASDGVADRDVASLLGPGNINLYKDYFSSDSFNKTLAYDVDFNFWTDEDKSYMSDKMNKVLGQSFTNTFKDLSLSVNEGNKQSFFTLFKTNLTSAFLDNFIKTLFVYKIFNGVYQFDFHFSPVLDGKKNFNREKENNHFVDLSNKEKLSSFLHEEQDSFPLELSSLSKFRSKGQYQYFGGIITAWVNVLDLRWNPFNPVPNPMKNAVKGYVKYRKYYRVNKKIHTNFTENKYSYVLESRKTGNEPLMMTVDTYKVFNMANLAPKLDRVEISFGKLLPHKTDKGFWLTRPFVKMFTKEKETGRLLVGVYEAGKSKAKATIKVKKLIFSFEDNRFLDSDIDVSGAGLKNRKIKEHFLLYGGQKIADSLELAPFLRVM